MEYFPILDVAPKELSMCVVDSEGDVAARGSVMTSPDAIQRFLWDKGISPTRIVHESGQLANWLYRRLSGAP